ncbi:MAG: signal peptidase I [Clostridium sp.]
MAIKVIKVIGNIIFYSLLACFMLIIIFMVKSTVEGNQPSVAGYRFYVVLTGSMQPNIKVGDLIVVKDTAREEVKVNDVITFGSGNSSNITTHRVIDILPNNGEVKYITKGDANNTQDPSPVEGDRLIGKVVKVIPKIGNIIGWIKNNLVIVLVVAVGITLVAAIFSNYRKRLKAIEK